MHPMYPMGKNNMKFIYIIRLGIGNLLEVMHEQELENQDEEGSPINDNEDYDKKSDTAEDFSDITELAEDLQTIMQVK